MIEKNVAPDFIIGGAPRSGTTFLCHSLSKHPGIYIPEPFIPEPKVLIVGERNLAGAEKSYQQLFRNAPAGKLRGEKSSHYLESQRAFECVRDWLPNTKMVFIVREPVSRAYSNYLRTKANGFETLEFLEAIEDEQSRPSPFGPDKDYVQPFFYMGRGRYDTFAARYIKALGKDRVRFFLYEDIKTRPEVLLEGLQSYLGIDVLPWEQLKTGKINASKESEPKLDDVTHSRLKSRFRASVQSFADLTGLDVSSWGYG